MLRHALLGLLARQPRHGYDLKNALEAALGGNWEINFGQIYKNLSRLERDGLITGTADAQDARGKKTYTLTDIGRVELENWLDRPVEKTGQLKDEFFVKLVVRHLAGYGYALAMIASQRQTYLERLRDLAALATGAEDDPFVSLLIEGAILHLQADLRWLDLCDERLETLEDSS
ncbi:MAG: helix-turn-helix transcriptional regulator [Anaerolineae bacterium]|nr:MAG: helix-turn-helix transcriptional regulator [Anaerolineae bacterium]